MTDDSPRNQPAVIMVAPNGARLTKADHPNLPISTKEIVSAARDCRAAGASALHLHVRDNSGTHSLDADVYAQTVECIATELGDSFPIQITTEAAGRFVSEEQIGVVEALRPRLFSVSIAEIHRGGTRAVSRLFNLARSDNLSPQIILYSEDDIRLLSSLVDDGTLHPDDARSLLLVIGRHQPGVGGSVRDFYALHLAMAKSRQLATSTWMCCAFGVPETEILIETLHLGGHIRVGFENSFFDAAGNVAVSNAERVAAMVAACKAIGRRIATPSEAMNLLS